MGPALEVAMGSMCFNNVHTYNSNLLSTQNSLKWHWYVDDEPNRKNLLISNATDEIVHRRSIFLPKLSCRGKVNGAGGAPFNLAGQPMDLWHNTPLVEAKNIPKRQPEYTTCQTYAKPAKYHATDYV